jgi:hypothetical protein
MRTTYQILHDNKRTMIEKIRALNLKAKIARRKEVLTEAELERLISTIEARKNRLEMELVSLQENRKIIIFKRRALGKELKTTCSQIKVTPKPPVYELYDPDAESEWAKELRLYTEAHHHRRNDEVAKLTCEECARLRAKAAEDIKLITGG